MPAVDDHDHADQQQADTPCSIFSHSGNVPGSATTTAIATTDPVTTPTLVALRASRARQETLVRWLRPLAPLVMAVVVGAAFSAHPRPGPGGRGLAVSIALVAFLLAGSGALATLRRAGAVHIAFVVSLLAASVVLMWVQPAGAGIAGIFVGYRHGLVRRGCTSRGPGEVAQATGAGDPPRLAAPAVHLSLSL